ncbi:DUF6314 family protein [Mameliella sp. AT18]|uniref:DUF6314 family protein n=1 Tax=Mameliella sp. AT18 TaxID=3028385 RepID=UPI00084113F8|nr:DUF6314 family protein [Mameliella sp. AT18]MDD9729680.1 DUF6314 family protein [Mameliella sp. AT18]ODM49641.1 trigger factor [Ruegeria sp. PBVC088]
MTGQSDTVVARDLGAFLGVWQVSRQIRQDDGARGRFEGTARWQADGTGAIYCERGQFWLGGQGPFVAERSYRWDADLTVYFEDGRLFHQVPAQGGAVAHWCPPDQYDGHYDFSDWPRWSLRWRVSGPRKGYQSLTRYTPPGGSGS